MDDLLHPEITQRMPLYGRSVRKLLLRRAAQLRLETKAKRDPNISIVIRTKNDLAYITTLFADIAAQDYTGKIEIILVDTCSSDGTAEFARSHGAKVVSLTQAAFNYPKALNLGFRTARYPYVVTLVGHSSLTTRLFLKSLTRWCGERSFGGVFGWPLPNQDASRTDLLVAWPWPIIFHRYQIATKPYTGIMGANSSIVSRAAWQQFGGYDERYAMGGEDGVLGGQMLRAGMLVVREPLCSVYHSHGLGVVDHIRQTRHWMQLTRPLPFDVESINRRRPDMRRRQQATD